MLYILISLSIIIIALLVFVLINLKKPSSDLTQEDIYSVIRNAESENLKAMKENMALVSDVLSNSQKQSYEMQDKRLADLAMRLTALNASYEQKLEQLRQIVDAKLSAISESNDKQLDKIRLTVDEKLQKTLDEKFERSFKAVSDRLEQVYKGLGEMQNLAVSVGDLKKTLSNVKTRGILGEIQLGSILDEILSPEQYATNVATKPNSRDVVEFAVRLPGNGDDFVYLPIDSKFPLDMYANLDSAYESGNPELISSAKSALEKSIKQSAKTIRDKYVEAPYTTDFAIMFLPIEGLYSEVVRMGMVEILQREYKINIAGPTTMAAMLNSLQMGFKTLAIQKHSGEVWKVLGAVKTEFDKFSDVLVATQNRIDQANKELDKLVGVRTRKIQSTLKNITALCESEADNLIE